MTQPLILNQDVHICTDCWGMVHPHMHHMHMKVCPGILKPTIPPPPPYGLGTDWHPVSLLNGWTNIGGQAPPTSYRATLDGDLQLAVAVVPGTFGVPMFNLPPSGWTPKSTYTLVLMSYAGASVTLQIQGRGDVSPGAVTPTRAGGLPGAAVIQGVLRIPLTL